jgi:hypothetical protein
MTKVKRLLKEKKGNALPLACAIVISLILIFSAASEYMRLQMIAKGVRDALQTVVISVATENYDNLYNGLREGYSGGYFLSDSDQWQSRLDTGDVYAELDSLLGLETEGIYHIKTTGGEMEYRLSKLSVNLKNTPFAPSNIENVQRFEAEAFIILEVPLSFGWNKLPPLKTNLKVLAGYTSKF